MYCKVCGYGGETKEACPRCGATGTDLIDIPALAQGPVYAPDELDLRRDEIGFTNPNMHIRMAKHVEGEYEEIDYPPSVEVPISDFDIDEEEPTKIAKYNGTETSPKIPDELIEMGITTIGALSFKGSDVYFVDIPEGITDIE